MGRSATIDWKHSTWAETSLPAPDLLDHLAQHDLTQLPPTLLHQTGRTLYQHLLAGEVAGLITDTVQEGRRARRPIPFEFRFDADQVSLARYPWETIADETGHLVRRREADVVR